MTAHEDKRQDAAALQAILTSIQVSLAQLDGKVSTLNARLEGRLDAHAAEQARLATNIEEVDRRLSKHIVDTETRVLGTLEDANLEHQALTEDVQELQTWRTKIVAIAGAVAFAISLAGQAWPLISR